MIFSRFLASTLLALVPQAAPAAEAGAFVAGVKYQDVDRFFRVLDAAGGRPDAATLQRDYLDAGSAGLREFIPNRIESADALARKIAENPAIYARARQCSAGLPSVERRVRSAYLAMQHVLPEAKLPDTTILIGRGNSGGTSGPSGALIGLEVACDPAFFREGGAAGIAHLIAHELAHTQQTGFRGDTLLVAALNEGVAEFIGELISGQVSNAQHAAEVAGREREIERAFAREMRGTDASRWLYNRPGTAEWPGDLGYWVGYRIARSHFERATDKRAAVREMLAGGDAEAFLKASGWAPSR